MFAGDDVRILGVPVGKIETIEPQPERVKITFWFDSKYKVPADVKAVILSPQLVTGRAIQLTPAYTGGPTMADGAVIPRRRTAVPVEWDDVRDQLQRLNELLQPTKPGGVSTLGAFINTAADNLRGQGATIRDTVIKLSQTLSALGDHSKDIFATSRTCRRWCRRCTTAPICSSSSTSNLAAVTVAAGRRPEQGRSERSGTSTRSSATCRASPPTTARRSAPRRTSWRRSPRRWSKASTTSSRALHIAPTALQNFSNIFEPANGSLTGALAVNNFANPIAFICGAIQAASRLGAEQSSKLCAQYLAPIVKNRQYNFPPLG